MDYTLPCADITLGDKLAMYEQLSIQAGSLQLHMQLPAKGSPSDSLATLDVAVEQAKTELLLPGTWREEQ